jgi:hypothetical protein
MLFLTLAMLVVQRMLTSPTRLQALSLGVVLACAVVCRPTNAVLSLICLALIAKRLPRKLPLVLAGSVLIFTPFLLFSWSQYGSPIPPYYLPSRIGENSFPFGESILMNLISPSRGLLIYDPIAIIAVAGLVISWRHRKVRDWQATLGVACVAHFFVIAYYGSTGGATYGPRLLLDIVPLFMILAVPALGYLPHRYNRTAVARVGVTLLMIALGWSLFVNATGALLRSGFCWSATPVPIDSATERVWDWSDPQFARAYKDVLSGLPLGQVVAGSCTQPGR